MGSHTITMQLGRSFLLFISLVLAYCAADIQVQQVENVLEDFNVIETGGLEIKDELPEIPEVAEDLLLDNEEAIEEAEEVLEEAEIIEAIEADEPVEEDISDILESTNEEENEDESVQLAEEITEEVEEEESIPEVAEEAEGVSEATAEAEDNFYDFDEEEVASVMDIDEAAEVISEEIVVEKKVGFFGRIARSLSFFGSKN